MCQQTVSRPNYRLQQATGANVKKNVINIIKFNIFNISKIIFYFCGSFGFFLLKPIKSTGLMVVMFG